MKINFTKSLIAAFISAGIFLSSCSQQAEEQVEPLSAQVESEFGTHPSTCNMVKGFGVEGNPTSINYIEEERVKIIVKGERRGHNGKYLDENTAKAFTTPPMYNDKRMINLLGRPNLLTVGGNAGETMHENGGRLILDFSPVGTVTMKSFIVYDIKETDTGSKVELFSKTGQLLKSRMLPLTQDRDVSFVGFGGDVPGVAKMIVTFGEERKLAGSGAISMLQMCIEGEGRCSPSSYGEVTTMWMQYTGDKPTNMKVTTKNDAKSTVVFSGNGIKTGHIFKIENAEGLGEAVLVETNRKENHEIAIAANRTTTLKKQYGSFKILEARNAYSDVPLCLE